MKYDRIHEQPKAIISERISGRGDKRRERAKDGGKEEKENEEAEEDDEGDGVDCLGRLHIRVGILTKGKSE